jgi:hypothetical protein
MLCHTISSEFFAVTRDRHIKRTKKAQLTLRFREPDWSRTNDPHLRRVTLYPAELPVHFPKFPYIYRFIWECKSM